MGLSEQTPSVRTLGLLTPISSGIGEAILRHSVAEKVVALNGPGSLKEKLSQVIFKKAEKAPSACAIVAINSKGDIAVEFSGRTFPTASCTSSSLTASVLQTTLHLLPQHEIYRTSLVSVGLTRYPITPGHTIIVCRGVDKLMSLSLPKVSTIMYTARQISATLISGSSAQRCGLACDGSGVISLLPHHGLSQDWEAVAHGKRNSMLAFLVISPLKMGQRLRMLFSKRLVPRIAAITGVKEPFNKHFDGDSLNQNIFARIIRGEIPQWRI